MSVANTSAGYLPRRGVCRSPTLSPCPIASRPRCRYPWPGAPTAPLRARTTSPRRRASASCGRAARAVDAAIAVNAALAVVAGHSCGLGGDAFWLIHDPVAADVVALNGSGRSAAGATRDAAAAAGLTRAARARPMDGDRARRRRFVARGARPLRSACLGGPAGACHRACRRVPGERRMDRRRSSGRPSTFGARR